MLTNRQQAILAAIVQDYAKFGRAVGSKTLLQDLQLKVSSATVRNEMALLERLGLLEKEHTSSGRIPSQVGYRYYVDELMNVTDEGFDVNAALQHAFSQNFQRVDDLVQQAVNELAKVTGYVAIGLKPAPLETRLAGFRLVALGGQQVMAIIVTSDGDVTSQSFRLPDGMDLHSLDSMVQFINQTLVNQPINDVLVSINDDLPWKMERVIRTPVAFLQLFGDVLARSVNEHVYTGGRLNLLDFSEAADLQDIKQVFQMIDSPHLMRGAVGSANDGIVVQIGEENRNPLLKGYTLLSEAYHVPHHGSGVVALLGPTSMPYQKTIKTVNAFTSVLADKVVGYY
ncbi:heat-inducible transcriptional repressor HrcA [Weissella halotolerans]|nr:heat-inducible transcriptional repressor HrcA [Weissella halotolerans]